jgi:hypothetical protein
MSFDYTFTLPARVGVPAAYPAVGANLARHHILGRKYIQLLLALSRETGVSEGTLKRFAGWPVSSGSTAPPDAQLNTLFFWSPYNLFIGPDGNHRGFDPSSGVEQICPPGFSEERWEALKAVPQYFENIGVDLGKLVTLEDNKPLELKLKGTKDEVKSDLTGKIKKITDTHTADKVPVYGFNENEWVAIKDCISVDRFIVRSQNVRGLYDYAFENKLIVDYTWAQVIGDQLSHKFILNPNA